MPPRSLLHICYFGYFVIGLVITVIGPAIPVLQHSFGLSLGEVGVVFVAQGVGYAVAVLLAGILSDRIGRRPVLIAGSAALSLGFLSFFAATTWPTALLLFFLASIGAGTVESAINSLAVDLSGDEAGRVLNLLHFFPAAGAVVGPYVADRLLPYGWYMPFLVIGALLALFFLLVLAAHRRGTGDSQRLSESDQPALPSWRLYRDPRLLVIAALLALYVGAEASISGWTFSYVIDTLKAGTLFGSTTTSLFWFGLMIGRMICSRIARRVGYMTLTVWMSFTAALVYLPAIAATSPIGLAALTLAAGVLLGGLFPTVVAHAADVFPKNVGAATGFIIAVCSIGGAGIPAVVGVVADGYGIRLGLVAVLLSLIGVALLAIVVGRSRQTAATA